MTRQRNRERLAVRSDAPIHGCACQCSMGPARSGIAEASRLLLAFTFRFWAFPGQPGYFRQSWGPGWALVGDAGYFKGPLTAHGITDALRDAELLARAIVAGSARALAEYQDIRDTLSLGVFSITDQIASFDWSLPELKERHQALSQEMQREVAWLRELDLRGSIPVETGAESCR